MKRDARRPLRREVGRGAKLLQHGRRMSSSAQSVFRSEAVAYREQPGAIGRPLRIDDVWSSTVFWLLSLALVATLAFTGWFRVFEYASGPALVRVGDARAVTVVRGGTVESLLVEPGQAVERGTALLRLHDAEEVAELARVEGEMETNLVRLLRSPGDGAAKEALAGLAARREKASALLADRVVIAPIAGVVSDVRVQLQQHVSPGDTLVTVAPAGTRITLTAVLPGRYRPLLQTGQTLRFSLDGNPHEYEDVVIERVGSEVVGPSEVRRYLSLSDGISLDGPSVLVHGSLPHEFRARGTSFRYSHGLTGRVDVRVREEPIVLALFPTLRAMWARR